MPAAEPERLLERVDRANRASLLAMWRVSAAAGMAITIVDEDQVAMAASREVQGRSRNRAVGSAASPLLVDRAARFFAEAGVEGWAEIDADAALLAGVNPAAVEAADRSAVFAAEAGSIEPGPAVPGVTVREVFAGEADLWVEAAIAADSPGPVREGWLRRMAPYLVGTPAHAHRRLFAADADGELVGVGALDSHEGIGWLTSGAVRPDHRNRGIQRALIGSRAAAAAKAGCTHVASDALAGGGSDRNLARAGLLQVALRLVVLVPRPEELSPPG
ncbi:MAG TPA: GNAT family N-acetyltransferase [Candidatus Limnocylindrales bacterium]|jgi:GNAT superfamily N-acetyltransferase